jgi:serine O-acetyltransferase
VSGPAELSLLQLIRSDIEATTHENFRTYYSPARFWARALVKLLVSANVRVVVMYRIAHVLAGKGMLPLALLIRSRGVKSSGGEINPLASIGPGFYLAHSVGVGVGAYVRIGRNCTLHLGTVVGVQPQETGGEHKYTVVGDDVFIGTHAVVLGGVTIGDGAVIGANSVVMRDVEPYTVISPPPARAVWKREQPGPAPA